MKRFGLILLGFGLALLVVGLLPVPALAQSSEPDAAALKQITPYTPGRVVYSIACATCHGYTGEGDGPGAKNFAQRPTAFTHGRYVLRSTTGRVPAPGDLERTIREGMPGTEMVPFKDLLTEASIHAVAEYIKTFSPELMATDPDEGEVIEIPEERPFPRTAQTIAEGKELWGSLDCGDCHGAEGRGTSDETDDWDFPVVMISFKAGHYKSGTRDQDLYRSIATGMQGTTMPAFNEDASPEETWKLVDYIRSLAPEPGFTGGIVGWLFSDRPSGFDYSTY